MKISILSIFPELFDAFLQAKLNQRAFAKKLLSLNVVDIRQYAEGKHRTVDDSPFGGGSGMVMKPDPIFSAVSDVLGQKSISSYRKGKYKTKKLVCFTPRGTPLTQSKLVELSKMRELVLICGRYEGIDERVFERIVDEEISLGDYVIQGGELPAMVFVEGLVRLIPGYLGKAASLDEESFENGLLEYPQYTRPAEFLGMNVPDVLLSGDHKAIREWRHRMAIEKTSQVRPDLMNAYERRTLNSDKRSSSRSKLHSSVKKSS